MPVSESFEVFFLKKISDTLPASSSADLLANRRLLHARTYNSSILSSSLFARHLYKSGL
jgi:hypothetical protein